MARTTLSPEAKALAAKLRELLGIRGPRSRCYGGRATAYTVLKMRAYDEEIPWPVKTALFGLDWSLRSGRVDFWVERYLKGLSDWQWCNFIADVATNCMVMGDVPYYLAKRFPRP